MSQHRCMYSSSLKSLVCSNSDFFFLIKENSFLCLILAPLPLLFVRSLGSFLKKEMLFPMHYGTLGMISESQKLLFSLCNRGKAWEIIKPLTKQTGRF